MKYTARVEGVFPLHWGLANLLQRFIGGTEELEGGTGELKQQLIRESAVAHNKSW